MKVVSYLNKCKFLSSLVLSFLLLFGLFSVNANASNLTENLVDSNISNWVDYGDESQYFQSANVSYLDNNVNYIEVQSSDTTVLLFDLTQFLKIGDSYRFSFNLPTTGGVNNTSLNSCELSWSLTDGSGDLYPNVGNDVFLLNINNGNKSNYLGKTTTFEFTYTQGFQNTFLCLFINPVENLEFYSDLELYISDVSLQRVTSETENKLDGILGWLEDIKNSIIGLGDKLTSVWENITASVTSLGDRISVFFSELFNTISTKFNELTTNFSNFITNLGDRISGFFDNLITNVKTFFEELPGKIFNYQVEEDENGNIIGGSGSSDGDTSTNNSLISINNLYEYSYTGTAQQFLFIEDTYARFYQPSSARFYGSKIAIDNVPISLDMNTEYKLSFNINNYINSKENDGKYPFIQVYFSDSQYNFKQNISENKLYEFTFYTNTPVTIDRITIGTSSIAFMECQLDISDLKLVKVSDDSSGGEENTGSVSWFQFIINKFKSWFSDLKNSIEGFFIKLYEDIKSLFIPSEGFFEDLSNSFRDIAEERFGALFTVVDLLDNFLTSFYADKTTEFIDIPVYTFDIIGYPFSFGGWQFRFIPDFPVIKEIVSIIKGFTNIIITFAFLGGLKSKYDEIFGGE